MSIEDTLATLLNPSDGENELKQTLVFVLGDEAREHIESDSKSGKTLISSINHVVKSRQSVHILFLNRLQYLFMYMMKFEAEEDPALIKYDNFIIYGLDILIKGSNASGSNINKDQLRLANLVFNAAFRVRSKHFLKGITFVPYNADSELTICLQKLERYWKCVC